MKLLICCVFAVVTAVADTNIVAVTQYADGSANTWTQGDLQDALGLMNRKYHRDMQSEPGRTAWHGKRLQQYLLTNDVGAIYVVNLYEDGYTHQLPARKVTPVDPEAKAKAAAAAKARAEAVRAAWEAANLPAELAALRAAQRSASGVTNEVTVVIGE